MFKYDIAANTWDTVTGMPLYGVEKGKEGKKKKSKDGACGAWHDGNIYALKGGNTQSFWKYYPVEDTWIQLVEDTMPQETMYRGKLRKKRVKTGADLVHYDGGVFFAQKGNKTNQFWRYLVRPEETAAPNRPGVMAGAFDNRPSSFVISPNPIASGFATVRFSLPKAGPATVTVYDVTGRSVFHTWSPGHKVTGSLSLDLRRLAGGVYLVRLDAGIYSNTQKLVVQK